MDWQTQSLILKQKPSKLRVKSHKALSTLNTHVNLYICKSLSLCYLVLQEFGHRIHQGVQFPSLLTSNMVPKYEIWVPPKKAMILHPGFGGWPGSLLACVILSRHHSHKLGEGCRIHHWELLLLCKALDGLYVQYSGKYSGQLPHFSVRRI